MERLEYRTIDKSSWPRGPWDAEPDKVQFVDEATGLPCLIVRNRSGALCGYAGVDKSHTWFGVEYSKCSKRVCEDYCEHTPSSQVTVHGGLTYSDECQHGPQDRAVCHLVGAGEDDDIWWFGFDCAHCDDMLPAYELRLPSAQYRDIKYVEREVAELARQLMEVKRLGVAQ